MGLLQIGIAALGLATFSRHEHGFLHMSGQRAAAALGSAGRGGAC